MLQWSYKDIVENLKSLLLLPASKLEGSFAGDIIQAVSVEVTRIYAFLVSIREQAYLDTAEGRYLERLAFLFNINRKRAVKATGSVTFYGSQNVIIPAGTLVTSEQMSFITLENKIITSSEIDIKCEAVLGGTKGNISAGSINKLISQIAGITKVANKENFSGGAREESDYDLRDRVYFRIRKPITSGNKYQYEEWARNFNGIGKVKVFPIWAGAGTVKVSILNEEYGKASTELIQSLKNYLDPSGGMGAGVAPVGAIVTVTTATEIGINIKCRITYKTGSVEANVNLDIKNKIEEYLKGIGYSDKQAISYAQIGYIIMTTSGVEDYNALTVNGITDNIKLQDERIAILGGVTINEKLA